jgi:hypothetical protein
MDILSNIAHVYRGDNQWVNLQLTYISACVEKFDADVKLWPLSGRNSTYRPVQIRRAQLFAGQTRRFAAPPALTVVENGGSARRLGVQKKEDPWR